MTLGAVGAPLAAALQPILQGTVAASSACGSLMCIVDVRVHRVGGFALDQAPHGPYAQRLLLLRVLSSHSHPPQAVHPDRGAQDERPQLGGHLGAGQGLRAVGSGQVSRAGGGGGSGAASTQYSRASVRAVASGSASPLHLSD